MNQALPKDNPLLPPSKLKETRKVFHPFHFILTVFLILVCLVTYLFALIFGTVYSPEKFQFIPYKYQLVFNRFLLSTTLPKTPTQILIAAADRIKKINKNNQTIYLSAIQDDLLNVPDNELGNLSMRLDGPVNWRDGPTINFAQNVNIVARTAYTPYQINGEIRYTEQSVFFKVNSISNEFDEYIPADSLTGRWYSLPFKYNFSVPNSLKSINTDQLMIDSNLLGTVQYLGKETINQLSVYHFQVNQEFQNLVPLLTEIGMDQKDLTFLSNLIKNIKIDLWTDQNNLRPFRIVIKSSIDPSNLGIENLTELGENRIPFSLPDLTKSTWQIEAGWEISSVNQPQNIQLPPYWASLDDLISNYQKFIEDQELEEINQKQVAGQEQLDESNPPL